MSAFQGLPLLDTILGAREEGGTDPALYAGRVDILFRIGRYHLFLPFAALSLSALLYSHFLSHWTVVVPFLIQVAAALATGFLVRAYSRGPGKKSDPRLWADRFTILSGISGAAWGLGAVIWFVPHSFPPEAFLTLGFLGMTAAEFIGRCAYRPAYLAHASLSLGPLAAMLFRENDLYAEISGLVVLLFGCMLYRYSGSVAEMIDGMLQLRGENTRLVARLAREKRQAETRRDLAETNTRAKSAFIAGVSHEIRTPLNALLGMTQLLERSELDRLQRSHVKVLLDAGYGLKTLLDDVVALSGGESGPPSNEDCDAAHAARTVARLLQPRAWEKQINLSVTAPSNLPRVAADPRRIRQVLLKLADNAIKFTQRGNVEISVDVMARDDGAQALRFQVIDTGLGVPPEMAREIFEPLISGGETYVRRQEGTGLGLAVAKSVTEALGGEIGFESQPGEGARFWFTVPAVCTVSAEPEAAAVLGDVSPPWSLSLLVWVAEEAMRSRIAATLEPFGNKLSFAVDGRDAIALAGRTVFDAIVVCASDADLVAAAPSVTAPVLNLVTAGMRLPVAATHVLRWPARASDLYAALRDLLGRRADESFADPDEVALTGAAIDASAFAALERSLGVATLVEILQSYIHTAEQLCTALESAANGESWDEAARIAQDIAGAAGGLGLAALTSAARGFTQKARAGIAPPALHEAADGIVGEHRRVRRALANLYPNLAA
jgi:signal transduction histidine kinase/HPt (histidine-containing phosphotransfer) domain-containing protein